MKKFILALLAIVPILAAAQKTDTIPFKGARKIILTTDASMQTNFKNVGNAFLDAELGVGERDAEFGQISTKVFLATDVSISSRCVIGAVVKDNTITLAASNNPNNSVNIGGVLVHSNDRSLTYVNRPSTARAAFLKLAEVVKLIPHTKVVYSE